MYVYNILYACLSIFPAIQVELSATEVDEGDGSVTGCAVYSGLEGPTRLFLGSIGAASATPADRYGKRWYLH